MTIPCTSVFPKNVISPVEKSVTVSSKAISPSTVTVGVLDTGILKVAPEKS